MIEKVICVDSLRPRGVSTYRCLEEFDDGGGYGRSGNVCTTTVFAMEVEASLRYWGRFDFSGSEGGTKVENASEVICKGWTEGKRV